MKQEPKAGRRIVSKGAYAIVQAKIAGLRFSAACLFPTAVFCGICAVVLALGIVNSLISFGASTWPLDLYRVSAMLILGGAAYCFGKIAGAALDRTDEINNVVPLTRANAADLPAPDSLVRASQEPAQAQEGVLLRAASGETQTGQEGHLLRASVGK